MLVRQHGGRGGVRGRGLVQKTDRFLWPQHNRSRATCMLKLCMGAREISYCGLDLGLACVISCVSVLLWLLGCSFQGVFLEVITVYFHFIFLVGNMFLKGTVSLWKIFSVLIWPWPSLRQYSMASAVPVCQCFSGFRHCFSSLVASKEFSLRYVYFHFIFLVGNMFLKGTVSFKKKFQSLLTSVIDEVQIPACHAHSTSQLGAGRLQKVKFVWKKHFRTKKFFLLRGTV